MTSKELKLLAKEIVAEQMRYEFIGIDEAAEFLGIKPKTLRNRLHDVPHGKFGNGKPRFRKTDLAKLFR